MRYKIIRDELISREANPIHLWVDVLVAMGVAALADAGGAHVKRLQEIYREQVGRDLSEDHPQTVATQLMRLYDDDHYKVV